MIKRIAIIGAVAVAIAILAVSYAFFKKPEEASQPIQSIPLVVNTPASGANPTPTSGSPAPATSAPAAEATSAPATSAPASGSTGTTVFEIAQADSQASFTIDEVLEGAPKTVVGTTNQVAGQIAVDPANPGATQVGIIQINARTLSTDSEGRNRAIKNRILMTDANEFITFAPTQLVGLPAAGAVGEEYSFQIIGDLTVVGVTKPVTFDVTVKAVSEDRLEGVATSTIRYADFEVAIPSVPMVASVEDTVGLELKFVATAMN
ncbi:MAG TPA: YceI family protein [Herpetosiphonaceae bacterium]|nr:YceI family protein [Herpetosiphonaceae bacterium]